MVQKRLGYDIHASPAVTRAEVLSINTQPRKPTREGSSIELFLYPFENHRTHFSQFANMVNFLSTALVVSSLPLIYAQYLTTTGASSTTSTTSATGSVHTIDVGKDGLSFSPSSLTVTPGDKVEFHFYPPAHSVAQSSFANPCEPISDGGFYSGLMVTAEESVSFSLFEP